MRHLIPAEYYAEWSAKKGAAAEKSWEEKFAAYAKAYPGVEFKRHCFWRITNKLLGGRISVHRKITSKSAVLQTVKHHKMPLKPIHTYCQILGGSADLTAPT